jgi:formylglycine-generating enzyme required for sulfatase activity/serine/threonine protein kinase
MDAQKALSMLGLTETATTAEIAVAAKAKMAQLQEKQEAAPTEALKAKFDQLLMQVTEAQALLQSAAPATASVKKPNSPLSQTKLADLPNMAGDTAPIQLQAGQILAGRYQIKAQIGAGGMGVVYSAFDQSMGRDIALKVLLPELLKNDTARERFLNEARISQQLSHPNIVNVFDVQNDGELYFLTMELLEGQDLRQVMENRTLARQPFTVEEAQDIANAIGTALTYAHKYTIHRDLKPENVWLTDYGVYKLMDFGIAQVQSTSQRTKTGAAMGTAYYMAPEQLKGQKDIDGRADQYALAVMLYELLSGEVPAGMIEPLNQHRKDAPKSMVAAIHQGLASKAENRFIDVEHFVAALTKKGGTYLQAMPWKPIGLAAGVLIALLGIGGVLSSGAIDFKNLLPASKEAIAAQKGAIAKVQGEIKVYKQRLENGRRTLDSDVRDAQRNNNKNLAALQHWQQLTENGIFTGSQITELEGELSMAETLLRENAFEPAQTGMNKVRDGYEKLWANFTAAEGMYAAEADTTNAQTAWQKLVAEYGLQNPPPIAFAKTAESEARQAQLAGEFSIANNHWKEAKSHWLSAPSAVASEVARIDGDRKAKQKAEAALKAKQKADAEGALKAKQKADAEAALKAKQKADDEAARQQLASGKQAVGNLVSIPAGSFRMGDLTGNGDDDEKPVHSVTIPAFQMQEHEVTFAQWDTCVAAGGCSHKPDDEGWGRGNRPVINVSYNHIMQQFIPWLNKATGQRFRLPSEAEWEYAARAGSTTDFTWGNSVGSNRANCNRCGSQWDNSKTAPVKSFAPNAYGLYDMHGNVWEWVQDCWNKSYSGAPSNGIAWKGGDCSLRVVRGGNWYVYQTYLRSADRLKFPASSPPGNGLGFRLVHDL